MCYSYPNIVQIKMLPGCDFPPKFTIPAIFIPSKLYYSKNLILCEGQHSLFQLTT